jgi:hypothetical protein
MKKSTILMKKKGKNSDVSRTFRLALARGWGESGKSSLRESGRER